LPITRKGPPMTTPKIVIMTDADVERLTTADEKKGFGALMTPQGPLPLKTLDVHANVEGLIAETSLTQTFVNTHKVPIEATYVFPLPDRAAVTRFRLEVAGRVIEGMLKDRAAARAEYARALDAGHRAAITEEERPGVFTMRVGNLPAGETATVRLTMVGPVIYDSGEVTFRFPLVVAQRYVPGAPLEGRSVGDGWAPDTDAVPDASRISPPVLLPGYPYPVRLSLTVDVVGTDLTVQGFRSSLHAVSSEAIGGATRITVQPGERLNRDFILRYGLGKARVETALTLVPDAESSPQEGTFVLTVLPPSSNQQSTIRKVRDVVFVLDRSGSMAGWKMVAARRALGRMIDTLTEGDRFTVYAFDDTLETPPIAGHDLVSATDRNRFGAIEWLARVEARGGTEMAEPLDRAVTQLTGERDRVLVLVTDGQVGNEDQILQVLGKRLQGIRIFTLGVDRAVNEAFLKRLAALGGGSCDVVESEDRLDEVMDKVQRRIGSPQLTGLRIEASGLQLECGTQVPARLPDLFAGVPLTVFGRYRGPAAGSLTLQATDEAGQPLTRSAGGRVSANHALAQVWARGRLRDLEDRWVVGADESPAALEQRILALSLRFGVLCRFTAFVAVDCSEIVNAGGQLHRLLQPVEAADGWEMLEKQTPAHHARHTSLSASVPQAFAMQMPALSEMDAAEEGEFLCAADYDSEELHQLMESPPPALRRSAGLSGFFGKMLGALRPGSRIAEPSKDDVDPLAAYRQRARELLEELRADGIKEHGLGVLAVKLKALIEDMKSIGTDAAALVPLETLLAQFQSASLARNSAQLCASAEKVLAAFADAAPSVV
jgi:Ca-activated chloride channel homolog